MKSVVPPGDNLLIISTDLIPKAEAVSLADLKEIYEICERMKCLCGQLNGVGLSAVQVGLPLKLFTIRWPGNNYKYYLNCDYLPANKTISRPSFEGCLSLPNRKFEVSRYEKILLNGLELVSSDGLKPVNNSINGFYSIVFQHEIDHHNSILISDIGKEI